jgi:cholesterol transport system auxiliary component
MRGRALRFSSLCVTVSVLALPAGCTLLAPPEPPMVSSLLDQMPAQVPHKPRSRATLLVYAPQARAAVDTTQMAYALQPHQLAYFARNQWAETPPQMLAPLLVRTLEATGAFSAVLTPPQTGGVTLGLRTDIDDLVQDFTQEPPVLRLSLRAVLSDEVANRTIATREWTVREPMPRKSPAGGVLAANEALARMLPQLAGFVLEHTP